MNQPRIGVVDVDRGRGPAARTALAWLNTAPGATPVVIVAEPAVVDHAFFLRVNPFRHLPVQDAHHRPAVTTLVDVLAVWPAISDLDGVLADWPVDTMAIVPWDHRSLAAWLAPHQPAVIPGRPPDPAARHTRQH